LQFRSKVKYYRYKLKRFGIISLSYIRLGMIAFSVP